MKTQGVLGRAWGVRWADRTRGEERGAALVEAAIAFPLLIMLLFGIVSFGRAYNAKVTLTHAAREGARELALTQDATAAENTARATATGLDLASLTFTSTACTPGAPTTVTLSYPFTYEIPVFGTNTITMTSDGVMRCGG